MDYLHIDEQLKEYIAKELLVEGSVAICCDSATLTELEHLYRKFYVKSQRRKKMYSVTISLFPIKQQKDWTQKVKSFLNKISKLKLK